MKASFLPLLLLVVLGACSLEGPTSVSGTSEEDESEDSLVNIGASRCGTERWSIKTGTDADASKIGSTPQATTIASLTAFPTPTSIPLTSRLPPAETTVWELSDVTLVKLKLENDSDYHMVLSDGTHTMIAEVPSPGCVQGGSPFAQAVQNARSAVDAKFQVSGSFQTVNVPVTVTGVGMFDFLHGQTGVAPNAIELHPVLSVCFSGSCVGVGGGDGGVDAGVPQTDGGVNDFSLTLSSTQLRVRRGMTTTLDVVTSVVSGSAEPVSFSVSGLPSGVTGVFSPSPVEAGATTTLTLTATSKAKLTSASFTIKGSAASGNHSAPGVLTVGN